MTDAHCDAIQALIEQFQRSGVRELHFRSPGLEILLSADSVDVSTGAAAGITLPESPSPSPAPAGANPQAGGLRDAVPVPPVAAPKWPTGARIIRAPYLGTFYRAPKPGAASFVEIGSQVSAESELCLVEVMKLFTSVRAGVAGTVHAIVAEDGKLVDPDQALFVLIPG